MKKPHWIVALILLLSSEGALAEDSVQLLTFKTHSRLVFRIDEGVTAHWIHSDQGFELFLRGLSLVDLGAPLGEESQWKAKFESLHDSRLKELQFKENSFGVTVLGKWRFPSGPMALAYPKMEYFDFHEKGPPKYLIDFWVKDGTTAIKQKTSKRRSRFLASIRKAEVEKNRRLPPRGSSRIKSPEIPSFLSYCKQPLSEANDIFLEFYPIHQPIEFSRWFPSTTVDAGFSYYTPKKRNREAQYIRLALELNRQGKSALVIRTLDFFEKEYPKSDFHTEMTFLKANSLIKLGFEEQGLKVLRQILVDAKDSPFALHSALFLSGKMMAKHEILPAFDLFLWLIQKYPDYPLNWVFHLGAAECLYALKQVDRAAREYHWVIDHAEDYSAKAEAAFRMGDLYLGRFQYEQAIGSYSQALTYFNDHQKNFPSFHLGRAEAFYQIGHYPEAEQIFNQYLQTFPSYPDGWRATFRLGEIYARQSKKESAKKWFYETINRYPLSPGATLARIRLAPCFDHGGLTGELGERFFSSEARNFEGQGEVVLKNYSDFRALSRVRTLAAMGSQDQVAREALQEMRVAKSPQAKKILSVLSSDAFRNNILELLANGKKYQAIQVYTARLTLTPPVEIGANPDYLLKLSRAASDLNLGRFASQLLATYKEAAHLPDRAPATSLWDLDLDLQTSDQAFSEAKALWSSSIFYKENVQKEKIRNLLNQVKAESEYSYEKELILALLDEKETLYSSALIHAAKAQLLRGSPTLDAWIAALQKKLGKSQVALSLYQELEPRLKALTKGSFSENSILGLPPEPTLSSVYLAEAEIMEAQQKWGPAATLLSQALEKSPTESAILYKYARALINSGDQQMRREALQILGKLSKSTPNDSENQFWKKLAQQKMENEVNNQSTMDDAREGVK